MVGSKHDKTITSRYRDSASSGPRRRRALAVHRRQKLKKGKLNSPSLSNSGGSGLTVVSVSLRRASMAYGCTRPYGVPLRWYYIHGHDFGGHWVVGDVHMREMCIEKVCTLWLYIMVASLSLFTKAVHTR